jgi:hypothetical protein
MLPGPLLRLCHHMRYQLICFSARDIVRFNCRWYCPRDSRGILGVPVLQQLELTFFQSEIALVTRTGSFL